MLVEKRSSTDGEIGGRGVLGARMWTAVIISALMACYFLSSALGGAIGRLLGLGFFLAAVLVYIGGKERMTKAFAGPMDSGTRRIYSVIGGVGLMSVGIAALLATMRALTEWHSLR